MRVPKLVPNLVALFAVVATVALAGSPPAHAGGKNQIRGVAIRDDAGATTVRIQGSGTPTFTVYKLERPTRVVVDVAQATLDRSVRGDEPSATFAVNSWSVSQVAAMAMEDGSTSVRVVVTLARPGRYDVKADGKDVVVKVYARDPAPKQADTAALESQLEAARAEARAAQKTAEIEQQKAKEAVAAAAAAKRAAEDATKADAARARAAAEKADANAKAATERAEMSAKAAAARAEAEARAAKAAAAEEVARARSAADAEIAKMKTDADAKVTKMKTEAEAKVAKMQTDAEARVAKAKTAADAEIAKAKTDADAEIAKARAAVAAERAAAQRDREAAAQAKADADRTMADAKSKLAAIEAERKRVEADAKLAERARDDAKKAAARAEERERTARAAEQKAAAERKAAQDAVAQAEAERAKAAGASTDAVKARAAADDKIKDAEARLARAEASRVAAENARKNAEKAAGLARQEAERATAAARKDAQAAQAAIAAAAQARTQADAATREAMQQRAAAESQRAAAEQRKADTLAEAERAETRRAQAEADAARAAEIRRAEETGAAQAAAARKKEETAAAQAANARKTEVAAAARARAARQAEEQAMQAAAAARTAAEARKQAAERAADEAERAVAMERDAAKIARDRKRAADDAEAEARAAARRKASADEIAAARAEAARLVAEREKAERQLADRTKEVARTQAEAERLAAAKTTAAKEAERLAAERSAATAEVARLKQAAADARDARAKEEARLAEVTKAREAEEKALAQVRARPAPVPVAVAPAAPAPAPAPVAVVSKPVAAKPVAAKPAAPKPTAKIASVRFAPADNEHVVVVDIDGKGATAELMRTGTRKAELVVHGATLPSDLARTLDTTRFGGPIRTVSSYTDPKSGDVRVVIELTSDVTPRFDTSGGDLRLAFAASSKVRTQSVPGPVVGGFGATSTPVTQTSVAQLGKKKVYRGPTIDLDFKDADIHDLLRTLGDVGRVSIVVPEEVRAQVTVRLKRVPWDQALDVILASKGLGYRREGNIYRIAPQKQLDAEDEAEAARLRALVDMEAPKPEVYRLNYTDAESVKPTLEPLLSPKGKIEVDKRTNAIVVNDVSRNRREIIDLATLLDTQTPQISIEARIVEARSQFERQIGIQWGGRALAGAAGGNATGLIFPSTIGFQGGAVDSGKPEDGVAAPADFAVNLPANGTNGALGLTLGSVGGNVNINLRLSALEETGTVRIISAPKVTVLNNIEAEMKQGVKIPISIVSAEGTQTQFVRAELSLKVTPYVSQRDCAIVMDVQVTKDEPDFVNTGARGDPTILNKEAKTRMLVADGETSVMGGIYTRNSGLSYSKIPFFGDLPVLGWLFKKRTETDDRAELLIFITPKITNKASLRCAP